MKIFIYFSLFIFLGISAKGQAPPFHWAKDFYGANASSVVVDDSEYAYVTGSFKGKVDLDPGSDTFYATSKGDYDLFISKFDFKGDLVWAKTMGDVGEDFSLSIKLDKSGNIYTTGAFYGEVDFDPGPATLKLTSKGDVDAFVLKLNNDGGLVWVKNMGGATREIGHRVRVDDSGNVITTGQYNLTADFDPGPAVFSLPGAFLSTKHLFISKLNKDGNFVWAKSIYCRDFKSTIGTQAFDMDKNANIYIAGDFEGEVDLDPGPGEVLETSSIASNKYTFILKLNSKGNYIWSKQFVGKPTLSSSVAVNDIKIDQKGDINTIILFNGTIDADPGTGYVPIISPGNFLSKLDSNGNYIWGKGFGGTNNSIFSTLDVDSLRNLYITGSFTGKSDFNPGSDTFFLSTVNPIRDIYISKLDKNGDFQWAVQLTGTSISQSRGIAVSKRGNIFIVGYFQDSIDYDPGIGKTYSLSKNGGAFLHKMSRCQTGSALTHAACNSFSIGRFTYAKTGKYKPFFTDGYGCDSIIDLSLDITTLSDSVTKTGATLTYSSTATTYQWVKCPSYSLVPGATGKSFTPASGGSYALIVSKGICTDTSKCIAVIPVNIAESKMPMEIRLSPNPGNGVFYIETDNQAIGANLNIYNVVGQKIKSTTLKQTVTRESLNPGVYFIEIINAEARVVRKLIVN